MIKKVFFKTALTEHYKKNIDILEEKYPEISFPLGNDSKSLSEHLPDCDAIVAGRFWPEELEQARNVKALFIPFTGVDAFDIKLISSHGIVIANSHGASRYVAERAIALAISLLGKVCAFDSELRKGYWHRDEFWTSIQDLTIGIWGTGHIGQNIAKILQGFGCDIIGLSRHEKPPMGNFIDITQDIDDFIDKCDIFFMTIPLSSETKGIIDSKILHKMKGKYLVNISRGLVVDEKALFETLSSGILKGAALDCWYSYPRGRKQPIMPSKYPFHELGNIIMSPHTCSHTRTARAANIEMTRKNIEAYIDTGKPLSIVDPISLYYK